jgi:hypothetical protein
MDCVAGMGRIAAGIVAVIAWAGLAVQLDASIGLSGSAGAAVWAMLRYFTILTNLIVAMLFTVIALGRVSRQLPFLLGGATLAILLVGIVYALLLRGLLELSGGARLADFLLHTATPILVPLYWLTFAPKGGLAPRDPLLWMLYPLGYFAYALARGAAEGRYAYPFFDAGQIAPSEIALNALVMAAGFLLAGFGLLWLDRRLSRD